MSSPTPRTRKAPADRKKKTQKKWKRASAEEVTVPSGNVALLKRPGMEVFLTEGLMPDALMPLVQQAIDSGKGIPKAKMDKMAKDPNAISDMMDAMDRVTARVVVEPRVLWHKRLLVDGKGMPKMEKYMFDGQERERQALEVIPEDERLPEDSGVLYTDDINLDDKSFIFQYAVGGTRDLERFREGTNSTLGVVPPQQDVESTA